MAKKNNAPASPALPASPAQIEAPAKKRLEIACQHPSCAGRSHGSVALECDQWEVPVYLLVHHFNHEGHKTEVRVDGLEYHRLASSLQAELAVSPSSETAPTVAASGATFRWGA